MMKIMVKDNRKIKVMKMEKVREMIQLINLMQGSKVLKSGRMTMSLPLVETKEVNEDLIMTGEKVIEVEAEVAVIEEIVAEEVDEVEEEDQPTGKLLTQKKK